MIRIIQSSNASITECNFTQPSCGFSFLPSLPPLLLSLPPPLAAFLTTSSLLSLRTVERRSCPICVPFFTFCLYISFGPISDRSIIFPPFSRLFYACKNIVPPCGTPLCRAQRVYDCFQKRMEGKACCTFMPCCLGCRICKAFFLDISKVDSNWFSL